MADDKFCLFYPTFVKAFFFFFYFTAVTFEIKCQICMGIKSLHDSLR